MQISYDLFQAQHRQKIHTHYLVFQVGFPFILLRQWFPQVNSEIEAWSMAVCVVTLVVLWECLTPLPETSAFWFRAPEAETEALGSPWHRTGCQLALVHQVLALTLEQQFISPPTQAFTQKSSSL